MDGLPAYMGIHCDDARDNWRALAGRGFRATPVECAIASDGVVGCIQCHKVVIRRALESDHEHMSS